MSKTMMVNVRSHICGTNCGCKRTATKNTDGDPAFIEATRRALYGAPSALVTTNAACCANCGKPKLPKKVSVSAAVAGAVNAGVTAAMAKVATSQPSLAEQVEQELTKHPGVFAMVNERTGRVATFAASVPYFDAVPQPVQRLRAYVSELGTKISAREANGAPATEVMRLRSELDAAKRELDEAEAGRDDQRRRERVGNDKVPRIVVDHNGAKRA
jgi:hypothetical protein